VELLADDGAADVEDALQLVVVIIVVVVGEDVDRLS
jgi:hypothetical protein